MTSILFSRDWYRIAHLKPRIQQHVEVHVHHYRQKRWYVLQNHASGQFRRLSPQAYLLVGLMDGRRTIEDIWHLASERLKDELPTHEEILQLVGNLYQSQLIRMDLSGDAAELLKVGEERRHKKRLAKLRSPLSVQIPLLNPNRFLEHTVGWFSLLFSRGFFVLWLLLVIMLLVMSVRHWEALTSNISDQILAADNLVLLWLIYPVIKLLHELGHGYVIKRFGGDVHEVGIMFLVFFPMPYVDATASTSFSSKYHRMLVDGAGMMVELFIAALAMLVWIGAEPGLLRSFAYNILFIAGVSTLLFNGNPLLRFDGYYLLADWLEIPNLAQKANQYWGYLAKRYLFAVPDLESTAESAREAWIYAIYGAASFVYRLIISITIALFVAQEYFFVGVLLAIWSVSMVWIWPVLKLLWQTLNDAELKQRGRHPWFVLPVLTTVIVLSLFVIPLPKTVTVEGVVMPEERGRMVVAENCFFQRWLVAEGERVAVGQKLMDCHSPELQKELKVNNWQLAEVQARRRGEYKDAVQVKVLDEEYSQLKVTREELEERARKLALTIQIPGVVRIANRVDFNGQWLQRGQLIGYVTSEQALRVQAMLPEYAVESVRSQTRHVLARTAADFEPILSFDEWDVAPASSRELISAVLADAGGGGIKMDPGQERQTIENYFPVELKTKGTLQPLVHQRVYVQFVLEPEPAAPRIYHYVRRTFLEYFTV